MLESREERIMSLENYTKENQSTEPNPRGFSVASEL